MTTECGEFVSWWDGEYEGSCELPDGHEGHHWDGQSCYDDIGDEAFDCKEHGFRR